MAVVPTGSPAWTRTASFELYGGHVSKTNYLGKGAIDATTDVAAEGFSRMVADLAALVRTAPFAVMVIQCDDSTPAAPTVLYCALQTGVRTSPYLGSSAPAGFPSVSRSGNGAGSVTFASSYTDEYGVPGDFSPRLAQGTATTAGRIVNADPDGGTDVDFGIVTDAGVAATNPKFTLIVW